MGSYVWRQWEAKESCGRQWEAKESCGRQWEVMGSYVGRLWEAVGGYRKPSDVTGKLSEVIGEAMGGCGRL